LFLDALCAQCVLKNIVTKEEWEDLKNDIYVDFIEDNYFAELKETEILRERLDTLSSLDEYSGTYFSNKWIKKNVLKQSEEEIKQIKKEIEDEEKSGDAGVDDPDGAAWD
jgi:hypothetical protein